MILALLAAAAVQLPPLPPGCEMHTADPKMAGGKICYLPNYPEPRYEPPKALCPASSVENEGGSVDTAMFGDGTCRDSSGVTRPMTCADVMQNYHGVYVVHGIFLGSKRCFPGGKVTPP